MYYSIYINVQCFFLILYVNEKKIDKSFYIVLLKIYITIFEVN
jgi:hypothetical protein